MIPCVCNVAILWSTQKGHICMYYTGDVSGYLLQQTKKLDDNDL